MSGGFFSHVVASALTNKAAKVSINANDADADRDRQITVEKCCQKANAAWSSRGERSLPRSRIYAGLDSSLMGGQKWRKGGDLVMLIRLPAVTIQLGHRSATSVYDAIRGGTFTTGVAIGKRARAWPSEEVAAINAARISGQTDEQIRTLVKQLHAKRKGATC